MQYRENGENTPSRKKKPEKIKNVVEHKTGTNHEAQDHEDDDQNGKMNSLL
jgi:hypothetical protein